ncbi:hypothetical protein FHR24_003090 [Wenyingzhuangia heitensis]|uniref:Uncharacterized protein n=1 Tax=Wenyingzhuangia heitensis TaxID=1487859 RepID=A0ABX0UFE7_9FLAO|nr:hypothetical protein [Wenyingzhuangia heitensis]NIJ46600.1 hypothetical protein [Wenyingzhuangia heitensis]
MKKVKIHPTELNHIIHSEKFTIDLFFIQTLIHLYESNVIKFSFKNEKNGLFTKKIYFLNINENFFNYSLKKFEYDFVSVFYENNREIELNKYISLVINRISLKPNWNKNFEYNLIFEETINDKKQENSLNIIKTTKHFNYFEILKPKVKHENKLKKSIYIEKTDLNYNLLDLVYEKSKLFILKKERKSRNSHWGNINATAGI